MERKRKITDEEFLELYKEGKSDLAISRIFKTNQSAIWVRRAKMGLIANFNNTFGRNLTKEELIESKKRRDGKRKYNIEYYQKTKLNKKEVRNSSQA